jgi:hypothetical protein
MGHDASRMAHAVRVCPEAGTAFAIGLLVFGRPMAA